MAVAFVQQSGAAQFSGTDTGTRSLTSVAAGNLLAVTIGIREAIAVLTVSDSVNGAWTLAVAQAGSQRAAIYFQNSQAGSPTITVTMASSVSSGFIVNAHEWSGVAASGALDDTAGTNNAATTSHAHGSITTTGAGVIISCLGFSGTSATETPNANFTAELDDAGSSLRFHNQYWLAPASTTTDGVMTTNTTLSSGGVIANFLEAAAGGGVVARLLIVPQAVSQSHLW